MRRRRTGLVSAAIVVFLSITLAGCASAPKTAGERDEARAEVRAMTSETLAQLFDKNPGARDVVAKAAGYAVFKNFGFKFIFMGSSKGAGLAVNNKTKQETFMKMVELQPGLGLGATKFRAVFIFESAAAFNKFVTSGWELGANVMAAAKNKTGGGAYQGAVNVSEGVYLYQLTEEGLIAGVSLTGAKYYKDKDLN